MQIYYYKTVVFQVSRFCVIIGFERNQKLLSVFMPAYGLKSGKDITRIWTVFFSLSFFFIPLIQRKNGIKDW